MPILNDALGWPNMGTKITNWFDTLRGLVCVLAFVGCSEGRSADVNAERQARDSDVVANASEQQESVPTRLNCLTADTLTDLNGELSFSSLSVAEGSGDLVGTLYTFVIRDEAWIGSRREAIGQLGREQPLFRVEYAAASQTLTFHYSVRDDTGSFVGKFSCDSVWGGWTPEDGIRIDGIIRRLSRDSSLLVR